MHLDLIGFFDKDVEQTLEYVSTDTFRHKKTAKWQFLFDLTLKLDQMIPIKAAGISS